jgi:hypothetical protein
MFAAVALVMIAPIVLRDPFATAAALMIGIFAGMLLESAGLDERRDRRWARDRKPLFSDVVRRSAPS